MKKQPSRTFAVVLIGAVLVLIGFVVAYQKGLRYGVNLDKGPVAGASTPPLQAATSPGPPPDPLAAEIIKELNCVCGCRMELAPCTCDERQGAREIRESVRILVQRGISKPEIIKGLVDKYGEAVLIKRS